MPRPSRLPVVIGFLLTCVLFIGGCATAPGRTSTDDPWQGFNRRIYKFNDVVDRATLKPVAQGYRKITPQWMRTGVNNFFNNLKLPWTMVNDLLQGKPREMAQNTCRLMLNTTVGLGGFIDVAGRLDLNKQDEDFGQTLAVWGVPSGPYLVLPFLGPSTVRDGFGRVPDYYGGPVRYVQIPWETRAAISALDVVQTREKLLVVDDTLNQAYDKYGVMRDAWLQRREYQIYNGNPPPPKFEEEYMDPADDSTDSSESATTDESTEPGETEPANTTSSELPNNKATAQSSLP